MGRCGDGEVESGEQGEERGRKVEGRELKEGEEGRQGDGGLKGGRIQGDKSSAARLPLS